MSNSENQIDEAFAKQLLRVLYKLDVPLGQLDVLISQTDDQETKVVLFGIMSEIMDITLNEMMIPIYKCHPSLGRASEPGTWLKES